MLKIVYFLILASAVSRACFGGKVHKAPYGKEYIVFKAEPGSSLTIFEAQAKCAELDATLPTVRSDEEADFIASFGEGTVSMQIGAINNGSDSSCTFTWLSDGSKVVNAKWADDQPKCRPGTCMAAGIASTTKLWYTWPCSVTWTYTVCETKPHQLFESLPEFQRKITEKIDSLNQRVNAEESLRKQLEAVNENMASFRESIDSIREMMKANSEKQMTLEKKVDYLYG